MKRKQLDYYQLTRNILISEIVVVITTLLTICLPKNVYYLAFMLIKIISLVALTVSLYMIISAKKRKKILVDEMVRETEAEAFSFAQSVFLAALCIFLMLSSIVRINIQFTTDLAICICYSFLACKDGYYIFTEHEGHKDAYANNED